RTAVVLLLLAIFLSPAMVDVEQRTVLPTIVIARDASLSMSTADRYTAPVGTLLPEVHGKSPGELASGVTRASDVNSLLSSRAWHLAEELAPKGKLELLDFGDQISRVPLAPGSDQTPVIPELVAEGRRTDLYTA